MGTLSLTGPLNPHQPPPTWYEMCWNGQLGLAVTSTRVCLLLWDSAELVSLAGSAVISNPGSAGLDSKEGVPLNFRDVQQQ